MDKKVKKYQLKPESLKTKQIQTTLCGLIWLLYRSTFYSSFFHVGIEWCNCLSSFCALFCLFVLCHFCLPLLSLTVFCVFCFLSTFVFCPLCLLLFRFGWLIYMMVEILYLKIVYEWHQRHHVNTKQKYERKRSETLAKHWQTIVEQRTRVLCTALLLFFLALFSHCVCVSFGFVFILFRVIASRCW